ncbi:hypothetical protein N7532_005528 [Penicillium argentinense]|uniref:NACHT domain-containing protein n=1 Tax=Penicillium argentinense TaxID=1131581 RepID=A0A9W9FEN4_9EURO|nr:uncharacterized protein N7532_005528 [Penicillium argentinense]KAJ5098527.1 hypothetical protein N7532_005528 [Penicillium argentinense]
MRLISLIASVQPEAPLNQACLRDLRITSPEDDKGRIERTNGGLLQDSYRWILDNEQFKQWQAKQSSRLLWIKGDPGKGKTMLLCGIINELTQSIGSNSNICFFFCQATDVRINNATAVLRGLIYSLVVKQASLLSHVRSRYDQAGKTLFEDINAWNALSKIFNDILKDATLQNTYLVIDALDECTTDLPLLLDLVVQESSTHPRVKWIVSSRNWPGIEERLDAATQTAPISLELNEISVSNAVQQFIQHKVHQLAEVKKYKDEIRDAVYRHLSSHSQGTFLWVALVCQDLNRTSRRHVLKKLKEFPPGLDALYGRMINQVRTSEDAEVCKRILAVMSIAYRPITLDELTALVEIPDDLSDDDEALLEVIAICGSFLTCREDVIVFVHQSAKEFLLERARSEVFPEDQQAEHVAIFSRCLQTMFKTLRHNILDAEESTHPRSLAAIKYAPVVDESWSLCLQTLEGHSHWVDLITWSSDGSRLASASKDKTVRIWDPATGQCASTLEGHNSSVTSIAWSPDGSRLASASEDKTVRIWGLATSQCVSTLKGHSSWVASIAWSPDGSRLASASEDKTVRTWDPATGQCASTLEGHSSSVKSIAWSPDGSRLASASEDKTVRIWGLATSQCVSTLKGHSSWVASIAWSPDGSRLASASEDKTVRTWDPATGQCASTLEGHSSSVKSIAWSPDGSRLASASEDKTVRIWDLATSQCVSTLKGHSSWVASIAWSPDGSRLASASTDMTVRIWDPATGQCVFTLDFYSYNLQFDKSTPNHLHTIIGTLNLGSTEPVAPSASRLTLPGIYGFGLSDCSSWITFNGSNLLWLPPEYRPSNPSSFRISAAMVAIGCSSGRVIFLALSEHNPLSSV